MKPSANKLSGNVKFSLKLASWGESAKENKAISKNVGRFEAVLFGCKKKKKKLYLDFKSKTHFFKGSGGPVLWSFPLPEVTQNWYRIHNTFYNLLDGAKTPDNPYLTSQRESKCTRKRYIH